MDQNLDQNWRKSSYVKNQFRWITTFAVIKKKISKWNKASGASEIFFFHHLMFFMIVIIIGNGIIFNVRIHWSGLEPEVSECTVKHSTNHAIQGWDHWNFKTEF